MPDTRTLDLLAALTRDSSGRVAAAGELAGHLGANDLLILLPDQVHAVHLPPLGFPQTLFGGRLWREFASEVIAKSFAAAELSYPTAPEKRIARGWAAQDGAILVLFDGHPNLERVSEVCSLLPLTAAAFALERSAMASAGQVRIAQQTAQQARELAESLDSVRRQLQSTLILRDQDIAERQRIETDLERSNADLQRFAYVAAHDLQEPLRTVVSYSQLLVKRYRAALDREAQEFLDIIVKGGLQMQELFNGLLSYSQLRAPFKTEPTDAGVALAAALNDLRSTIEATGATVTHDVLPVVLGEKTQFIRLFANLVGNSLKYRAERPPHIHVTAQRREFEWVISVRDNGIGIDPKYQDRIFDLFQRLHGKEYPGTGLGLATCRQIVERLGGRIWVEGKAGEGSTFSFTLPYFVNTTPSSKEQPKQLSPTPR